MTTQIKRRCVVHSDASFDINRKVGAWAVRLSVGLKDQKASGMMPLAANDSGAAELFAAYQGIIMALRTSVHSVLLYTDSMYVKRALEDRVVPATRRDDSKILFAILAAIKDRQIEFSVRHIRAHSNDDTAPALRNRWCDAAARTAMADSRVGGTL